MKINRIDFKKHDIFNNHTVIFGDTVVPIITFLVGDNGSGKTRILDAIYDAFTNPFSLTYDFEIEIIFTFSEQEKIELGLLEKKVIYNRKKEMALGGSQNITYVSSGDIASINIQQISKVVYSTIEVNFNERPISTVTSKNIDEVDRPKEKSNNLSSEIPQLLVDIKNLDDSDQGVYYKTIKGKVVAGNVPTDIGNRLERFTNAFHKIYEGSKTFSDIRNVDGAKRIAFTDSDGREIGLNDLSTGEKQIIYRIGYILKNMGNIHGGIILIDEPEISLHPSWQMKLKDFLLEVFAGLDVQIIIATHSPYIFKNFNDTDESCIKVDRRVPVSEKISLTFPGVPYSPSVNLINYLAYGIVSEVLHIELYTLLQIREGRDFINNRGTHDNGIEDWLRDPTGGNIPIKQTFTKTGKNNPTEETIMTWIRNKIHHADEQARPAFNASDLKISIDKMIALLQ